MKRASVTTIVFLALCANAGAQPKPSPQDLDAARKHFQLAEAAKARGEYQTAAVEYLAAYELFEEPAFFFDTAEVYRLAGEEKQALVYYTKYLELAPNGEGAAASRAAADTIRRSLAAKEDAARPRPHPATVPAPAIVKPAPEVHVEHTGRGLRIGGLASSGVGVVAIGVGIAFGIQARRLDNDASSSDAFDKARDDRGKAYQRNMFVFTGVGVAALATGGVLYFLGHRAATRDHVESVSLSPIDHQGFAVTASGHF